MKKKVEYGNLKTGIVFKRKGSRTLCMVTNIDDAQILTGKEKGKTIYPFEDELVTPVKVKISEVK